MAGVLRSLLVIVVILGVVGGSAFAVFSDATTDTTTLGAGTVNITKSSGGTWSGDVDHLVPGQQVSKAIVIRNAGNVDFDWSAQSETSGALFEGTNPATASHQPSQGELHPGETQAVDVSVGLPLQAGNEYQTEHGKLTVSFEATSKAPAP